jgi:ATP-dependent RNA helicase DeaD
MPKAILDITNRYQKTPELIKVVHKELTATNVEQFYLEVHSRDRVEVLSRLLDMYQPELALAFCNTKKKVDEVTAQLQTRGFACDKIHGDMKQQQRDAVMDRFRHGKIELLIATDVAARGLDINGVECVFNIDVPQDEEYYVHRIGRTGRAGSDGRSFTFVSGKEFLLMKDVMRYTSKKIQRHEIPSISDIEEIKAKELIDKLKLEAESGGLEKYYALLEALADDGMTSLEAAAILMKLELERHKIESEHVSVLNTSGDTGAVNGMVRLFVNVGKNIELEPRDVIKWITGETTVAGDQVGSIDIYENFSFVEVPEDRANEVFEILKNAKLKGKRVRIDRARGRNSDSRSSDRKPRTDKTYKGREARPASHPDRSQSDRPKRKY